MSSYRLQYADDVARNRHRVGHAAASGIDMTGGYIGPASGCYKSVGDLIGVLLCQW